uniref:Uncharacterized protein n=1 Tax=Timema shepardi TaxID=629360 RepID=A0A7R9G0X3_TIMSH|nr:unnamed protein product [Timema shepardi]
MIFDVGKDLGPYVLFVFESRIIIIMASDITDTLNNLDSLLLQNERKIQKKLRHTGQPYISRSGKLIPAKKQSDLLCNCPQHCDEKVPNEARLKLFYQFYKMADQIKQNDFLMSHIEIRAVQRRSIEMKNPKKIQRRVSCKYKVPVLTSKDPPIQPGGSPEGVMVTEVCQKAFMNIYAITEKRVRLQREKLISQTYLVSAAGEQPQPSVVRMADYKQRFENFCATETISADIITAWLLRFIGPVTYQVLTYLCSPVAPGTKTFAQLKRLLETPYAPTRSVYEERSAFSSRNQRAGESYVAFSLFLCHLAATCSFGIFLDDALKS